jgi:hypothetical protein
VVAGGGGCPFIRACVNIFSNHYSNGIEWQHTRHHPQPPLSHALDFSTRDGVVPSFHGSFPEAKKDNTGSGPDLRASKKRNSISHNSYLKLPRTLNSKYQKSIEHDSASDVFWVHD